MRESALASLQFAESFGIPLSRMIVSAKVSEVPALIRIHRSLAEQTNVPIHFRDLPKQVEVFLELFRGFLALSILLSEGIGDTIRVFTHHLQENHGYKKHELPEILQSLELRTFFPKLPVAPDADEQREIIFSVCRRNSNSC